MKFESRKGLAIGALVALLAAGALVFAHPGGGHGPGHGMDHGEMSAHFQAHVKKVLAEVKATPEQQTRINEIVAAAVGDLQALHSRKSGELAEFHQLLTAPSIDRARLEQLRTRHIAALDAASQRCAAALADAAEVLTPEQRAQLGEKMAGRHAGAPQAD